MKKFILINDDLLTIKEILLRTMAVQTDYWVYIEKFLKNFCKYGIEKQIEVLQIDELRIKLRKKRRRRKRRGGGIK